MGEPVTSSPFAMALSKQTYSLPSALFTGNLCNSTACQNIFPVAVQTDQNVKPTSSFYVLEQCKTSVFPQPSSTFSFPKTSQDGLSSFNAGGAKTLSTSSSLVKPFHISNQTSDELMSPSTSAHSLKSKAPASSSFSTEFEKPESTSSQPSTSATSFSFVATLDKVSKKQPTSSSSADIQRIEKALAHHFTHDSHSGISRTVDRREKRGRHTDGIHLRASLRAHSRSSDHSHTRKEISSQGSSIIPHLTSIVCKGSNLHPDINNEKILYEHFSKFGAVKSIRCSRRHEQAVIKFYDHASAEEAKRHGTEIPFAPGPVQIFWIQTSPSRKDKLEGDTALPFHKAKHKDGYGRSSPFFREKISLGKKEKVRFSDAMDVDDELQSMLEVGGDHKLLVRPEEKKEKEKVKLEKKLRLHEVKKALLKKMKEVSKPEYEHSQEENLRKIVLQEAHTAEECFSVLDARDKLIRLCQTKQSTFDTALAGTCPDMCPEKERYSRFAQKCLSVLEQKAANTSNKTALEFLEHQIIVKDYSRSSADQEEPLPHELRPTKTLQLTMDYLLCNVVNKCSDSSLSIRDWYDFIWSRTRAVRKDITQQHLNNMACVEIVEKCTRFHIHCAAALCEEDMAIFDHKINDENITKCLQTLKHFYEDFGDKNMFCPNEPEFRAYDILLSLKEGDTLRHVQKLHQKVRESQEIRFAVSAVLSYSSNNYVRFFKLVDEASYLNACILHRYFNNVRVQALHVILKAYCAPNRTEQYPVADLQQMLKFESFADAVEFCEMLGFKVDDKCVHLDRLSFAMPLSPIPPMRSLVVVESKRTHSLAEIINNGPLGDNPLPQYSPHHSFDSHGCLRKEALDALDQGRNETDKENVLQTAPRSSVLMSKEQPQISADIESKKFLQSKSATSLKEVLPSSFDVKLGNLRPLSVSEQKEMLVKQDTITSKILQPSPRSKTASKRLRSSQVQETLPTSVFAHELPHVNISLLQFPVSAITPHEKPREDSDKVEFLPTTDVGVFQDKVQQVKLHYTQPDIFKECSFQDKGQQEKLRYMENDILKEIIKRCLNDILRNIASDVFYTEQLVLVRKEREAFIQRESSLRAVAESVLSAVLQNEISEIVRFEFLSAKARLDILSHVAAKDVLENVVRYECLLMAEAVHAQEKKAWLSLLKQAKEKRNQQISRRFFTIWHEKTIKKREERLELSEKLLYGNPVIHAPFKPTSAALLDNPVSAVAVRRRSEQLLGAGVFCEAIQDELAWLPLDLTEIFERNIVSGVSFPQMSSKTMYWKLLLVFSGHDAHPDSSYATKWFCAKFMKGQVKQDYCKETQICSLYWLTNRIGKRIAICVRSIYLGNSFDDTLKHLQKNSFLEGTCAVLLCSSLPTSQTLDCSHFQLKRLLEAKRSISQVPLYCFVLKTHEDVYCVELKNFLSHLKEKKLLTDCCIAALDFQQKPFVLIEKLMHGVNWLVSHCPIAPTIPTEYLKDYICNVISEVFRIVYEDLAHRKNQFVFYQDPCNIIAFFCTVLEHRASVVCSSDLMSRCWPMPEVNITDSSGKFTQWGCNEKLRKIELIFSAIYLPMFKGNSNVPEDAWSYILKVKSLCDQDASHLLSSAKHHLERAQKCSMMNGECVIPWADILHECAYHLAAYQDYYDPSVGDELEVRYLAEDLLQLDLLTEWNNLNSDQLSSVILSYGASFDVQNDDVLSSPPLKKKREEEFVAANQEHSELSDKFLSELKGMLDSEKRDMASLNMMLECQNNSTNESSFEDSLLHCEFENPVYETSDGDGDDFDVSARISMLKDTIQSELKAEKLLESTVKSLSGNTYY